MAGLKLRAAGAALGLLLLAGCENPVLLRLKQLALEEAYRPWAKAYYGSADDQPKAIDYVEEDGGYVVAGNTSSFSPAGGKGWLLRLAADGSVRWQKVVTVGLGTSVFSTAVRAAGEVIYAAGFTMSAKDNAWIAKLDLNGNVQWQRRFDATGFEFLYFNALAVTGDGGAVAAGSIYPLGSPTSSDVWVAKFSAGGAVQWQKRYDLSAAGPFNYPIAAATSIEEAYGGYVLMGQAQDGSQFDYWVMTLDSAGAVLATRLFASGANDFPGAVKPMGGGYVAAGTLGSVGDALVIRLSGDLLTSQWNKTYGSSGSDEVLDLEPLPGGGLVLSGKYGGGTLPAGWLFKLSDNGTLQWSLSYGEGKVNQLDDVLPIGDYGLVATGEAYFGPNQLDFFVQTLQPDGGPPFSNPSITLAATAAATAADQFDFPEGLIVAVADTSLTVLASGLSFAGSSALVETYYPSP